MERRCFSQQDEPIQVERWILSTCGMCSIGCGVDVGVTGHDRQDCARWTRHRHHRRETRLCTATTASSLTESFGADGPPVRIRTSITLSASC